MLWLLTVAAGLVAGLLAGGSVDNIARIRFRWPWTVVGAVVVRVVVLVTPLNHVEGAQYVYVLALAAIVAWTLWHVDRLPGIWIVSAGTALNLVVIVANGARMPVAAVLAGTLVKQGEIGQYALMGPGTHLSPLGDWISLPPLPEVYSPGDIIIAVGLAVVLFFATRGPRASKPVELKRPAV